MCPTLKEYLQLYAFRFLHFYIWDLSHRNLLSPVIWKTSLKSSCSRNFYLTIASFSPENWVSYSWKVYVFIPYSLFDFFLLNIHIPAALNTKPGGCHILSRLSFLCHRCKSLSCAVMTHICNHFQLLWLMWNWFLYCKLLILLYL